MHRYRNLTEYAICLAIKKPYIGKTPSGAYKASYISNRFTKNPNLQKRFNDYLHLGPLSITHLPSHTPNFIHPITFERLNVQPFSSFYFDSIESDKVHLEKTKTTKKEIQKNVGKLLENYFTKIFSTPILLYDFKNDECSLIDTLQPITFPRFEYNIRLANTTNAMEDTYSVDVFYYHNVRNICMIQVGKKHVSFQFSLKEILQTFRPHFYYYQW